MKQELSIKITTVSIFNIFISSFIYMRNTQERSIKDKEKYY
jgi:hypothetical protein